MFAEDVTEKEALAMVSGEIGECRTFGRQQIAMRASLVSGQSRYVCLLSAFVVTMVVAR